MNVKTNIHLRFGLTASKLLRTFLVLAKKYDDTEILKGIFLTYDHIFEKGQPDMTQFEY